MINYINAQFKAVSVHYIGDHADSEGIKTSPDPIRIREDDYLRSLLLKYFFDNFKEPEFFSFTFLEGDVEMNPVYKYVSEIFENPTIIHEQSKVIAKYLYNQSTHPNIKSGDLMMSYVEDLVIDDELVSAIVIFKSEAKDSYLKLDKLNGQYAMGHADGISISKLDKACVIFNTEKEDGYKLCVVDKSNRNKDAIYWRQDFLNIESRSDDYYKTKVYIQATKAFVNERLKPLYDTDKSDEAYILNASQSYLKQEESFNESSYLDSLFGEEEEVKKEFKSYKKDYQEENNVELHDSFDVSQAAVKNQSKIFKSVLKLDKNFSVYIHGNRNMVEKGVDDNGRKFYKLFYDNEA